MVELIIKVCVDIFVSPQNITDICKKLKTKTNKLMLLIFTAGLKSWI